MIIGESGCYENSLNPTLSNYELVKEMISLDQNLSNFELVERTNELIEVQLVELLTHGILI